MPIYFVKHLGSAWNAIFCNKTGWCAGSAQKRVRIISLRPAKNVLVWTVRQRNALRFMRVIGDKHNISPSTNIVNLFYNVDICKKGLPFGLLTENCNCRFDHTHRCDWPCSLRNQTQADLSRKSALTTWSILCYSVIDHVVNILKGVEIWIIVNTVRNIHW